MLLGVDVETFVNEFSDCDREQLNNDEMAKLCKSSNVKMNLNLKMILWRSDCNRFVGA